MRKLFLDDIRTIDMVYGASEEGEFDIVRNYQDFVNYIKKNGLPDFISFDNDLGLDEHGAVALDGYAAAKWLVYESDLDLSRLEFKVHSANPVASEQIRGLLNNYQAHIKKLNEQLQPAYQKGDVFIEDDHQKRFLVPGEHFEVEQNESANIKVVSSCSAHLHFLSNKFRSKVLFSNKMQDREFLRQVGTYFKLEETYIENEKFIEPILAYKYKGLAAYMIELTCDECDDVYIMVYAVRQGEERPPLPHTFYYVGTVEKEALINVD